MPAADRHEFHRRALAGRDRSHKDLSNPELDAIMAEFLAVSSPSIHNQMRMANMSRTRALHSIRKFPWTYIHRILVDRFGVEDLESLDLHDLHALAATLSHRSPPRPEPVPAGHLEDDDPDWSVNDD